MTIVQFETRRLGLPHQLVIVGGDDDRGTKTIEFNKEAKQATRHLRIDIAGRLVGEQQLGLIDDGPGNSGTLLFSS